MKTVISHIYLPFYQPFQTRCIFCTNQHLSKQSRFASFTLQHSVMLTAFMVRIFVYILLNSDMKKKKRKNCVWCNGPALYFSKTDTLFQAMGTGTAIYSVRKQCNNNFHYPGMDIPRLRTLWLPQILRHQIVFDSGDSLGSLHLQSTCHIMNRWFFPSKSIFSYVHHTVSY